MLLTNIFGSDIDPVSIWSTIGGILSFAFTLGFIYSKLKSRISELGKQNTNLETQILANRQLNINENIKVKADLLLEISRIDRETEKRENTYKEGLAHITLLVDNHSKSDDQKFDRILSSLSKIGEQNAVALDRIALIVDGKLGNQKG